MMSHSIEITRAQSERIDALVGGGLFASEQDVLNEALALIEAKQALRLNKIAELKAAVQVGIDDIEAGRFMEFSTADEITSYFKSVAERTVSERAESKAA